MQNDLDPKGLDLTMSVVRNSGLPVPIVRDIEAMYAALSAVPDGEGELVERIGEIVYRRHERGFVMWPLVEGDRIKAELSAALAASRLSQAGVRVTDEMVQAVARSHYDQRMGRAGAFDDAPPGVKAAERNFARTALEAALSGDTL